MSKTFLVICALIVVAIAEKPGPYPAKGWKPQGARLELPRAYGTPSVDTDELDITTVANEYLPPTTTDFNSDENDVLRVQGLPAVDSFSQFRQFQKKRPANIRARPQLGRIQLAPAPAFASQPLLLSPQFAPKFAPVTVEFQQQRLRRVETDPKRDVQQLPARAYGPPASSEEESDEEPEQPQFPDQPFTPSDEPQNSSEEEEDDDAESEEESDDTVIAVSNTQDSPQNFQQGQSGQYYILLPDKSLQKVRFATKQTVEDRQINGFSAQLRYSPVEAIKDPVFGYDQQGKLVRLYK